MSKYPMIKLLVAVFALVVADATTPKYLKICNRNEPDLDNCIKASILELKPKLINGIPELEVPPLDPLDLGNLPLNFGNGFNAMITELVVTGGKNFEIVKLKADLEKDTFDFTISIPELDIAGRYDIDATIAGIPLKGKGPLILKAKTLSGVAVLHAKKTPRNGKTRYWFSSMDLKVDVKDYNIKLINLFEGEPTIGQATNKLLNEEKNEVLSTFLPAIEKALVERALFAANNICKHFTYEELFPGQ